MAYLVGGALAITVCGLATTVGFDRDRAFYPTLTIVIASYYGLFAVMGGSNQALIRESVVIAGFLLTPLESSSEADCLGHLPVRRQPANPKTAHDLHGDQEELREADVTFREAMVQHMKCLHDQEGDVGCRSQQADYSSPKSCDDEAGTM